MNTLFVAMQDQDTRRWTPVARLTREDGQYRFLYTQGSKRVPEFETFGRMSKLGAEYVSDALFPLFANRVLVKVRPEYPRYLRWLGMAQGHSDAMEELGRTGGLRATDGLELIPCPEPTEDGRYEIRFFARGMRHLPAEYQASFDVLEVGQRLYLMHDLQKDFDAMALMMRTGDPVRIVGYLPRYYSGDVVRLLRRVDPREIEVFVDGINPDAPMQYRLRCRLTTPWPEGFAACEAPEFRPIVESAERAVFRVGAHSPDARAA